MLNQFFKHHSTSPVFVHSDIMPLIVHLKVDVRKTFLDPVLEEACMNSIVSHLKQVVDGRDVWMPTFNYDFCQTGLYDTEKAVSQVGSLTEYFRRKVASWRSLTPIFSMAGEGIKPMDYDDQWIKEVDPFSRHSDYHELMVRNGIMLFYGVGFSPTFTHYIERNHKEGPLYRYDKLFGGKILMGDGQRDVTVKYHVIPRGLAVRYDMPKIFSDLMHAGLLHEIDAGFKPCHAVTAKDMAEFCWAKMDEDPLYLLTPASKEEVDKKLTEVGRRFLITDFNDKHHV